jgi:tripartite-type tricarboxylate transporter receptor subunit TctC
MTFRLIAFIRWFGLMAVCSASLVVNATDKPQLTIVSGYAAGGLSDRLARLTATHLSDDLKIVVNVKNLPGAAGLRAAQELFHTPPQFPTLFVTDTSLLKSSLTGEAGDIDISAFTPIGSLGHTALAIVVPQQSPITSLNELVKTLQTQKSLHSFGSPGLGSIHQLFIERLLEQTSSGAVHIPYQGGNAMLPDLFQKRLTFGVISVSLASTHAKAGNLRVLATTGSQRSQFLPQVPTVIETYPAHTAVTTAYLMATPQTLKQDIELLGQSWQRVIRDPTFSQGLLNLELEALPLDRTKTRELIENDKRQLRQLGVKR